MWSCRGRRDSGEVAGGGKELTMLDESFSCWKIDVLRLHFDSQSMEAIRKIKPLLHKEVNPFVWVHNPKGNFSIKSAYLTNQKARFHSNHLFDKACWLALWAAPIHEKYKIFLWKIAWDILPTRGMVSSRFAIKSVVCPICEGGRETIDHLFLDCSLARILWRLSPWSLNSSCLYEMGCRRLLFLAITNSSVLGIKEEEKNMFLMFVAILAEHIWRARNKLLFENERPHILRINSLIKDSYKEHGSTQSKLLLRSREEPRWEPPPSGWVKLNFDVAMRDNKEIGAVVFRNEARKVMKVVVWELHAANPLMAEATSALFAIKEAVLGSWPKIMFEGDSKLAIDPLKNWDAAPDWCIAPVIEEARNLLISSSFLWSITKVHHSCNGLAHNIAQWAANFCRLGDINITSIPLSVLVEGSSVNIASPGLFLVSV